MISAKQQRFIHKPLFWLAFTFAVVFLPAISGATSKLLESPSHPISLLSETEVQSLTSVVGHQKRAGLGMLPRARPYIDAPAAAVLFDEVWSEHGINDWPKIYWASREVGPLLESPELIQIRAKAKELSTAKEQVLATLRVHNIQVRGIWKVWDGEESLFSVRALNGGGKGELLLTGTLTANKTYRVTVSVEDDFRYLNEDYQNLSVQALITIKVLSGQLSVLPVPRLTATAGYAGALHKLLVSGGQPPYAYTLSLAGFSVLGGTLSLSAETPAGLYTVSVEIRDSGEPPLSTMAEVTVQVWETLSGDLASGFVQTTYVGESGILGRLSLVGGSGNYGYQLADDSGGQFGVGAAEVSVIMASAGVYTLSVIVTDRILPAAAWPPATMVLSVWVEPSLRLLSLMPSSHISVLATAAKDVVLLSVLLGGGRQFAGGGYQFVPPSPNVLGWSARGLGIEGAAFELSLTAALAGGAHTVTVMFTDDYEHTQPGTPTVSVLLTIEGLLSLSSQSAGRTDATLIANVPMTSIYIYRAEGGVGALSYSYQGGQGFAVDSSSGVLAYDGGGDAGVYTLSVVVDDESALVPPLTLTVVVLLVSQVLFNHPFLWADITTRQHAAAVIFTVQAKQGVTTAADGYTYRAIDGVPSPMTLLASGSALLVSLTAAIESPQTLTLQIEARDAAEPPTRATMRLEVRVWDVLSGKLSDDFVRQTYQGEDGALGEVQIAGGSGGYLHTITAADFEMDTAGRLVMDAAVNEGVYVLTIWSSDKLLSEQGWLSVGVLATVSVGAPFALAEWPRVLALQAGEDGEELLTLSAEGGAQPYTYNAVGLPAALTMSLSADNQQVFRRLSGGELLLGDNVATIVVHDGYAGPTTPGTGELTALVTIEGVANLAASLSLRVSVPSDFVGTVGVLSVAGGLGEVTFELQPSSVFALSGEHLLVTASLRGDANAALLTAHLRVRRGVETVNTLAVVAVSAALSLSWSAELSDVPAGYIGEVAQLAASGGYAGDLTYALLPGAGYQVEPTSGVVSISAAISGTVLTASLVVWRGLEQSEAVVLSVRVGGVLSVVLLSPLSLPLSLLSGRVEEGVTLASWSLLAGKEPLSATLPGDAEGYGITLSSRRASWFAAREVFLSAGSRTLTVLFGDGYVNAGLSPSLAVELPLTVLSSLSGEASRSLVFAPLGVSSFPLLTEIVPQGGAGSYTISLSDSRFGVDASNHLVLVSAVSEVGTVSVVWVLDDGSDLTAPVSATIIVQFVEGLLFIEDMRVVHVTAGLLSDQIYEAEAFGGAGDYTYIVLGDKPSALSFADGVVGVSMALLANTTLRLTIEASDNLSHRATVALAIKGYDVLSASVAQSLVLTIWAGGEYVLGTLLVSGGTGDYEFAVSPDDFMVNSDREIVSQEASSGIYTLTVWASDKILSDSGWVTAMVSLTVRVFDNLSLSAPSALTVESQYTGALATLRALGGDGDYTFALSDSEIFALGVSGDETVLSITAAQNGGSVHTLTITLQDKIGSPWSKATISVVVRMLPFAILVPSGVTLDLVAGDILVISIDGGEPPVLLDLAADTATIFALVGTTLRLQGESFLAGVYSLTIEAVDGGGNTATAVVSVVLSRLAMKRVPLLYALVDKNSLYTVQATGGMPSYTYRREGDKLAVEYFHINSNNGVLGAGKNFFEQGVPEGDYYFTVIVKDAAESSSSVLVTASSSEWATVLVGSIEINDLPQTQFNPKTFEGITAAASLGSTVQIARKGSGGWEITLYGGGEMVFVKDKRNPLAAVVSVNTLGDLDVIQTDTSWPLVPYYHVGDEAVRVEAASPASWHYRRFNGQVYLLLRQGEVQMLLSQAEAVQIVPLSGAAAVHMTDGVGGTTLSILSLLQEKVRRITVLSDEVKILATLSAVNNFVDKITWSLVGSSPYITIDADSGVLSVTANLLPNHDVLLLTVAMDDKTGMLRGLDPRRLLLTVEIIVSTGIRRDIFVVGGVDVEGVGSEVWRLRNNEWVQTAEDFYEVHKIKRVDHGFVFYQGQLYVSGGEVYDFVNSGDMWSSADGITWNEIVELFPHPIANHVMVVHKGKILVFGGGRSQVWLFDGEEGTLLPILSVKDMDSAAEHLGILYAAGGASSNDVWRTLDGGNNWQQIAGTLRFDAGAGHLLSDDKWLYFIGENAKIWRSVDGVAWSVRTSSAAFGSLSRFFAFAGTEGLYVGGGVGNNDVWQSVDEGLTWKALSSPLSIAVVGGAALEVMPPPVYPLSIYSPPSELTIFNVAGAVATLWPIGGDYDYHWSVEDDSGNFQIDQDGVVSLLEALSADYHVLTITAKLKDGRQVSGVSHVIVIELKETSKVAGATVEVETTGAVATLTAWYGYGAVSYELLREPPFFAVDAQRCQERCVVIDGGTARSYGVAG